MLISSTFIPPAIVEIVNDCGPESITAHLQILNTIREGIANPVEPTYSSYMRNAGRWDAITKHIRCRHNA